MRKSIFKELQETAFELKEQDYRDMDGWESSLSVSSSSRDKQVPEFMNDLTNPFFLSSRVDASWGRSSLLQQSGRHLTISCQSRSQPSNVQPQRDKTSDGRVLPVPSCHWWSLKHDCVDLTLQGLKSHTISPGSECGHLRSEIFLWNLPLHTASGGHLRYLCLKQSGDGPNGRTTVTNQALVIDPKWIFHQ